MIEKEQNKWVVCKNSFAKGTKGKGVQAELWVGAYSGSHLQQGPGGPKLVLVPPFPRVLEVFLVGTMECWEFFKAYKTEISKLRI